MRDESEPPECAVVTSSGDLLIGALGGPLEKLEDNVSALAWSDDGALLAFARRESVTVRDYAGGRGFTTRLMSGVRGCQGIHLNTAYVSMTAV